MKRLLYNLKLDFQLALKNILAAGLRSWLNIGILSFAFITILFFNGMMDGWEQQAVRDSIDWEYGDGQYLHPEYEPLDPFTIEAGHGTFETHDKLTPILIRQGNIYPSGRMLPIMIKGIDLNRQTLKMPVEVLKNSPASIPVLIGNHMAKTNRLKVGDEILMRWKDKNGTFDAQNITIAGIFESNVPAVDIGQVWMSLEQLWELSDLQQHASLLVKDPDYQGAGPAEWRFKSQDELLQNFYALIEQKKGGSSFLYIILLLIALIAIFDAQVFSVFKRQKEIGTYIALGFTRKRVTFLFTLEGTMYAIMACIIGGLLSIPLFAYLGQAGIPIGNKEMSYEMGISVTENIYPIVGLPLISKTFFTVSLLALIVGYWPVRKIAKMNPVDALKGKKI
ncbi:ABC transporter permease [Persicobacter diffluens]|uniref:ABC3 transporter permease C-terminal domain-containing protein n=1 Tax=Persicobacter diffluens TaxID=981 RepID=A0AAN4W2K4_9BACT|nr:hypothetical protein PEDI_33620 [Persicobacter diffluens]